MARSHVCGLVRDHNQGRRVSFLEYEAYEPLAVRALNRIVDEARHACLERDWGFIIGSGDSRLARPASSSSRSRRIGATRLPRAATRSNGVKQIVPIWTHEHFEGGDVWLEGATADPDNDEAREAARRIACT
jgi:molybdopterin synthase catalytic subunit